MKIRFTQFALAVCSTVLFCSPVWSQSTLYFNRGEFIAVSETIPGNQQAIDFRDAGSFDGFPSLTISGVTFTGRALGEQGITSGVALYNFDSGFPLGIQFANGARAFGGDFSSYLSPYYSSFTATLSLDSGEVLTFTAPTNPDSTFFGFISPIPIRSMTFSDGGLFPSPNIGHQELIGNLYMVTVPEPAAIALAGLGATLLLGWRFLRRKP